MSSLSSPSSILSPLSSSSAAAGRWDHLPRIVQPPEIKVPLFPHQLVSVYQMEQLERTQCVKVSASVSIQTRFGILGDLAGYGKSMSLIALIVRDQMPWDVNQSEVKTTEEVVNSVLSIGTHTFSFRAHQTVIVTSANMITQWLDYFAQVTPGTIRVKEVTRRDHCVNLNCSRDHADVFLVNSTRYNEFVRKVHHSHGLTTFKRFIFDDATSTHIPSMLTLNAGFMWFVTATANESRVGSMSRFMREFYYSLDPDFLLYVTVKNDDDFVRQSFQMPQVTELFHECVNPNVLRVLQHHIDSDAKVMIEAGNIRGAIERLGGANSNTKNLIELVSTRHKTELESARYHLSLWSGRERSQREVDRWTRRVAEIEHNLQDLNKKYQEILAGDCCICYSALDKPVLIGCCQNIFCFDCIHRIKTLAHGVMATCPMCRAAFDYSDLIYISRQTDSTLSSDAAAAGSVSEATSQQDTGSTPANPIRHRTQRHNTVVEIIRASLAQSSPKRFLVFSEFNESFQLIRQSLRQLEIPYAELTGTKATRDAKLRKFRDGTIPVLFLNSLFNGAGLNLECTDEIILYHRMSESVRTQNVGRALRVGRSEPLVVHIIL